jgi:predicted house-cleaning NTP pyrophosphatase (Maf/HAM1 superfamily)
MRKLSWKCLAAFAVAASITVPAFAQEQQDAADNPRAVAVRDCSAKAEKWSNMTWQSAQIITYGNCMADHNQPA